MALRFEDKWVSQASEVLRTAHPDWDEEVLEKTLRKIYNIEVKDPKCTVVNNYRNTSIRSSLTVVISLILTNNLILGGDGCMFVQHSQKLSLLAEWIADLMKERKALKKQRDSFDKGTTEWQMYDLAQNNKKIMLNSLYGILGYMKFHLFNVNLAQATTAMGQSIISTATCHFENFISDNIKFVNVTEFVLYLMNIIHDYERLTNEELKLFSRVPPVTTKQVADRLADKVGFNITEDEAMIISRIIASADEDCLKLMYYKNNLFEFLNIPFCQSINTELLNSISILRNGDIDTFDFMGEEWCDTVAREDSKSILLEIIKMLKVFVLYKHQIFDRVRRTRYTNKSAVLYIDTDSNFISVVKYIMYAYSLKNANTENKDEFTFKSVNIFTMILTMSIAEAFESFTEARQIAPEWGKKLAMKNELYWPIIVFGTAKKRYFGQVLLQEGKFINGIDNQRVVAGFDFKKAGTKESVRQKCHELIDTQIILAPEIDLRNILRAVREYEAEIKVLLQEGDNSLYKQLTVHPAARYKAPLSNQGYKAVHLWNAFNPAEEMAFPAEVDLVPVTLDTGMSKKKYLMMRDDPEAFFNSKESDAAVPFKKLYYEHREIFENYYRNILMSSNEYEWTMSITCIAKPRDMTNLPAWMKDIINSSKIITDVVNLINPIIDPLGPKIQKTGATTQHYTNIVNI